MYIMNAPNYARSSDWVCFGVQQCLKDACCRASCLASAKAVCWTCKLLHHSGQLVKIVNPHCVLCRWTFWTLEGVKKKKKSLCLFAHCLTNIIGVQSTRKSAMLKIESLPGFSSKEAVFALCEYVQAACNKCSIYFHVCSHSAGTLHFTSTVCD